MRMELYYSRKENKICTQCGVILPDGWDKRLCEVCNNKNKERLKLKRIGQRYQREFLNKEKEESLDEMATEAHEKHLTYGKLQAMKIIERLRRES